MPFSRQTINPHHPSILRTIHAQVATPINRGYTHEPHFLTATFFFLLLPAFVREYALLLLLILSLSRIIVVTVPVYCELYMSRLQHPSTVGIPMNHNFSLPHFFFLLLQHLYENMRCCCYSYCRCPGSSSSFLHTIHWIQQIYCQVFSRIHSSTKHFLFVFFSFQHNILCTHNALHYSGPFVTIPHNISSIF